MTQAGGRGAARPAIGVALEGDLGRRIDAVLAVALLQGFVGKTEARSIALCVSRSSLSAAQFADVLVGFYGSRPAGGMATIGMPEAGPAGVDAAIAGVLARTVTDGTRPHTSAISRLIDTADNAVLIRNMLLAQHDGNAAIVLAGPATGLARLLNLYGARPQIAAKVRHLVVAMGSYPSGPPDPDVASDVAAARTLFAGWPTPVIVVGSEVGAVLPYPGQSIEQDFTWSPAHPVADAYRAFRPMPYDAPAPALAAVVQAVHPDAGYFTLSDPGTIRVLDDGGTRFEPGAGGRHRYLLVDPTQAARVTALYRELVSARPAPRPGR